MKPAPVPTLREFYPDFKKLHYPTVGPRTKKEYSYIFRRHLIPAFGDMRLNEITERDCALFFLGFSENPYTGNAIMRVFSKAFAVARQYRIVPHGTICPSSGVKQFKTEPRPRCPSKSEAIELWAAIKKFESGRHFEFSLFIQLLIYTGARPSELEGATWEMIKEDGIHLTEAKHRIRGRIITLGGAANAVLSRVPRPKILKSPTIFKRASGAPFTPQYRHNMWHKLLKTTSIKELQVRDLRRLFASLALSNGVGLDQLGRLLGHRNTSTTLIYAHLMKEDKQKSAEAAASKLDEILGGAEDI